MMEAGQYYEGTVNQVMGDGIMRYKALAEKHGSLEDLAWFPSYGVLYRVKALIAQQQGAPDQASQHFEQSLQLMSAHGYKPDPARKHYALGQFKLDQGQAADAKVALEIATHKNASLFNIFEL